MKTKDDWQSLVRSCPVCGARPAWHETEIGVNVHCTDDMCPRSEGVEAPTFELAVKAWNREE